MKLFFVISLIVTLVGIVLGGILWFAIPDIWQIGFVLMVFGFIAGTCASICYYLLIYCDI